jgi:hypothetical protein
VDEAIAALPPAFRRKLMITCDGASAGHDLVKHLDKLAARRGHHLVCSVGRVLGERERAALCLVPETAWEAAIDAGGKAASAAQAMPAGTSDAGTGLAGSRRRTSPS